VIGRIDDAAGRMRGQSVRRRATARRSATISDATMKNVAPRIQVPRSASLELTDTVAVLVAGGVGFGVPPPMDVADDGVGDPLGAIRPPAPGAVGAGEVTAGELGAGELGAGELGAGELGAGLSTPITVFVTEAEHVSHEPPP
jgi:hypothetical protein